MPMFDPFYVSKVLADILSRETGVAYEFKLTKDETPPEKDERSA